ncbi:MAG TPA: nucleoside deaminase [Candidatus Saccharimonadales bacterium]|nr:nucleoside deaminase [Candidatus Saccharimonadales bacterium]
MIEANEAYMELAIAAAQEAKENGGVAIGAILVRESDGHIIAKGGSLVGITHDPTSHAEVNCIREATNKLETDDLYDYTLYSTLEPCHMCLSTAAWARIPRIFFGAHRKDVDPSLFDITGNFSDEQEAARMNLREDTVMHIQGGILESKCADLLDDYHDGEHHHH